MGSHSGEQVQDPEQRDGQRHQPMRDIPRIEVGEEERKPDEQAEQDPDAPVVDRAASHVGGVARQGQFEQADDDDRRPDGQFGENRLEQGEQAGRQLHATRG